ncbi:hypothetical protein B0J12DRAFT_577591, partial [Macrophomina phaseolina]
STPTMDAHGDALQRLTGSVPEAQGDETATPAKASPAAPSTPTRSNTLSWQQRRPNSSSGRRPLSQIAVENNASRSPNHTPEPSTPADDTASRAQIAQSLSSKDPSWFKQTPDRGIGSAANRRSREDEDAEAASISDKRQLPGLSRDTPAEAPSSPPAESVRSSSPSRASSARGSAVFSNRFSRDTSMSGYSASEMKSPLPTLDSQRFRPPTSEHDDTEHGPSDRGMAMSPSQGRMAPERTPSPTKGMGGFVQSAMMRRSDSVNKRWSVQTGGTLSRQNSVAGGVGGPGDASTPNNSTEKAAAADEPAVRPALSLRHNRGKSVSSITQLEENRSGGASPVSPTKRWSRSPIKSSWLESALSAKPDTPKPKPQPEQPSWMAEISKIKAQKASVDLSNPEKPDADAPATPNNPTKFPGRDALRKSESRGSAQGIVAQSPDLGQGPPEEITDREQHPAPESAGHIATTPKSKPDTLSSPKMETAKDSAASPTLESPAAKAEKPAVGVKSPGLRGADAPASKSEDPSKPDFRTTLKHRQRQSENPKKEELEFQNVFGKLKKTHTEKFVAPDTFRENITRGKNALNLTGGVPPRVRRDEFKETLVKQRESIKLKAEESGGSHVRTGSLAKPAEPVAEALEFRKHLGRTGSNLSKAPPSPPKEEASAPEALTKLKSLRERKLTESGKQDTDKGSEAPSKPPAAKLSNRASGKLADRFNPGLAAMLARGPSPGGPGAGARDSGSATAATSAVEPEPGSTKELTHMTKGRARGPKRRAPKTKAAETPSEPATEIASPKPVRKASVVANISLVKEKDILSSSPTATSEKKDENPATPSSASPPPESKPKPVAPAKSAEVSRRQGGESSPSSQPGAPKPLIPSASRFNKDNKSPTSPSTPSPKTPTVESPKPQKPLPQPPAAEEAKPPTPAKDKPDTGASTVKSAAAMWSRQSESGSTPGTPRVKSPIKLPTKKDEQEAMENAGLIKPEADKPIGLGIATPNENKEDRSPIPSVRVSKDLPAPPAKTPLSPPTTAGATPPKPAKKPDSISSSPKITQASPIPQQSEAGQLFADFFDEAPVSTGKLDVDTHAILTGSPLSTDRVKTARKEIQEITGDGKLSPVPPQEEHILFDNSMYLCTHVFAASNGAKNTEVYLWTGSAVPEPTIEDAQLFARKAARDVGGKLLIVRQGKECPNFFQAVGGILITRKGTRTDHSKQYMLCGRQHLGNMAFDEVEFSLSSLCSGFAYLISSRTGLLSGKIFLWKGKGCNAEELGCARLIGMDLGLTPEIEEIDEGKEPASFLDIFPAPDNGKEKRVPRSADHWRLKAKHDKYGVRLFRIDEKPVQSSGSFQVSSLWPVSFVRRVSAASVASSQGPSSPTETSTPQNNAGAAAPSGGPKPNMSADVVEIAPFSQADLEAENIYCFLHSVVGALSHGQSHAFSTALLFAQEYGILAASLQDRPFVPVSTVVLEGVPRDMKAVFRGWQDQMQPTAALMSGKPRRGKSLRIVGLQAAIAATRENATAAA